MSLNKRDGMKNLLSTVRTRSIFIIIILFIFQVNLIAQEDPQNPFLPDTLIKAAREMMINTRYCALITLDELGHPQARTMDAFPPEKDLVVWLGTNSNSRKVKEIQNNNRVTLYYEAPQAAGYVTLKARAELVNDPQSKQHYWKEEWDRFYSDGKEEYLLIQVVPLRMEIVDYSHGITSKSNDWAVPYVEFDR
jgi:general stress protein 26